MQRSKHFDYETTVRSAARDDCPEIAEIYNEAIREGVSTMDRMFRSGKYFEGVIDRLAEREALLVACVGDVLVGWGSIKNYSERLGYRVACETSVYLAADHRGLGFGSMLQKELLDHCRQFRFHHVVAKIYADNNGSVRFHERFGFEKVGIQKEIGFVAGSWKDVMIMQLVFGDVAPFEPDADQAIV